MTKMSFKDFVEKEFRSDPDLIVRHFYSEISSVAAEIDINWADAADRIDFKNSKITIGKKAAAWGETFTTNNGVTLPTITFNNLAGGIYEPIKWSAWDGLMEMFAEEQSYEQMQAAIKRRQRLDQQQKKAEERRKEQERLKLEEEKRTRQLHKFYRQEYEKAQFEDGSFPYLVRKQISDIVRYADLRRMEDERGKFVAVKLVDTEGNYRGLQRLYENDKIHTKGAKVVGAHCILGDLETADKAIFCEGYATGASLFLSKVNDKKEEIAVIVTFSATNMKAVAKAYMEKGLNMKFMVAADNDQWQPEKGNPGLFSALTINRKYNIKAIHPDFKDLVGEPTDFNDLHCREGLKAVESQLKKHSPDYLKAGKKPFEFLLKTLRFIGQKSAEKRALIAIANGMSMVPYLFEKEDIINAVIEAVNPALKIKKDKLENRANWILEQKTKEALTLRSFSEEKLNQDHVRYIPIKGHKTAWGGLAIPPEVAELIKGTKGPIILRSPTGTGKTEKIIQPVMEASYKAAYLCHRVSLVGDACKRLGIHHYQDTSAEIIPHLQRVGSCVNSIVADRFLNIANVSWFVGVETLCIDEATQTIRHIVNGNAIKQPTKVLDTLIASMANAERVLLCDADASDLLIELCENSHPGQQITVIEITGEEEKIDIHHTNVKAAFKFAMDALAKGEKILIATDSKTEGHRIVESEAIQFMDMLEDDYPDKKVLFVHAESKGDPAVERFFDDPNGEVVNYDMVIYSPALSSGVSITVPHFDKHFAIFHGKSIVPSDCIQMIRRDRTAKNVILGLAPSTRRQAATREEIHRALFFAHPASFKYETGNRKSAFVREETIFDEMHISCKALENKAKNDFANNLLLMLEADRFNLHRLAHTNEDMEAATKMRKVADEIYTEKRHAMILNAETPTEEEYENLRRTSAITEQDAARMKRYRIINELGLDEITEEDIIFYESNGLAAVRRMEILLADEETINEYEQDEVNQRVTLTQSKRLKEKWQKYQIIFQVLGIDLKTGEGVFNHENARTLMNILFDTTQNIDQYNSLEIGPYINPQTPRTCPTKFIKAVFDKLGLTLVLNQDQKKLNRWEIDPLSWAWMMSLVDRRQERKITSIKIEKVAFPYQAVLAHKKGENTSVSAGDSNREGFLNNTIKKIQENPPRSDQEFMARAIDHIQAAIKGTKLTISHALDWFKPDDYREICQGRLDHGQIRSLLSLLSGRAVLDRA